MPKSLKEALLEQLGALQERGLAPAEVPEPEEPDEPAYAGYSGSQATAVAARPRAARARPRGDGPRRDQRDGRAAFTPRGRGEREEFDDAERGAGRARRPSAKPTRTRRGEPELEAAAPVQPAAVTPVSRTDLLRERAEQRRRDDTERQEITGLLQTYRGAPVDEEAVGQFFEALTEEVGALPPLRIVGIALKNAGNDQLEAIGGQVRRYYRSARARQS